jgi:hypothetical protein
VWIRGYKVFGPTVQVREIATSATRNKNLLSDARGALEHGHAPATLPCFDRAHEAGRPATENNYVKVVRHD